MKSLKYLMLAPFLLAGNEAFAAGQIRDARIDTVRIEAGSGYGYVQFQPGEQLVYGNGYPNCQNLRTNALAFSTNTPGGRAIYQLLTTGSYAHLSMDGTGKCSMLKGVEDLNAVTVSY